MVLFAAPQRTAVTSTAAAAAAAVLIWWPLLVQTLWIPLRRQQTPSSRQDITFRHWRRWTDVTSVGLLLHLMCKTVCLSVCQLAHPLVTKLSLTDLQQDAVATLAQGWGGCQASRDWTLVGARRELRVDPPADLHEQSRCGALCGNIGSTITIVMTTPDMRCALIQHVVCNRDEWSRVIGQSAGVLTTRVRHTLSKGDECNGLCDYTHTHRPCRGTSWLRTTIYVHLMWPDHSNICVSLTGINMWRLFVTSG